MEGGVYMKSKILKDGFVVVPQLLSSAEMDRIDRSIEEHFASKGVRYVLGYTQPNIAILNNDFIWVITHEKILAALKKIISSNLVFTGHSDIHQGLSADWHKDDGAGAYFKGLDYFNSPDCLVYKVGIYAQDHEDAQGLTVRKGSHYVPNLIYGEEAILQTKRGDVVIFDVRITHKGRKSSLMEKLIYRLDKLGMSWLGDIYHKNCSSFFKRNEKRSLFFTYAMDNEYSKSFSAANMSRQIIQSGLKKSEPDEEMKVALEASGVGYSSNLC